MSSTRRLGPNAVLVKRRHSRSLLVTPALVLDLDALEHNLGTMAGLCTERNIALRPHAKTHKSVRIAQMQIGAGAVGVCVATVREADIMVSAGIPGVHLTTPVHGSLRLEALVSLIDRSHGLSAVVDDLENLKQLEASVRRDGAKLPVIVDLDLGAMFRSGVASGKDAVALADALARSDVLEYAGVQYYSGIVQHVPRLEERAKAYGLELERLAAVIEQLGTAGFPPRIVTGGGTGTLDLDARSRLFTENQAGSYAVMDVEYGEVELLASVPRPFEPALFVQATVISNNARGLVTIDAGTKSLATDGPPPRPAAGAPEGAAYHSFGDEFGMIVFKELAERIRHGSLDDAARDRDESVYRQFHALFDGAPGERKALQLGAKVELVAPHCDPTVNLHDFYHCVRGDTLVDIWPVDARGPL